MYLNKAILSGRLTKVPELKALPNGGNVCTFDIAINRTFKDKSGEKQEATEFLPIVMFGRTAEVAAQYLERGQLILVEGRIQTRSWDKTDGSGKGYKTEVVVDTFQFGPKAGGRGLDAPQTAEEEPDQRPASERGPKAKPAPSEGIKYPEEDINPEDIPF